MCKVISIMLLAAASSVSADFIRLQAHDAMGTSSFNSSGNWNVPSPPGPGKDYVNEGYLLRTPSAAGNYTFAGFSLKVGTAGEANPGGDPFLTDGTVNRNALLNKTPGNPIIRVDWLFLGAGYIRDGMGSDESWTLEGRVIVHSVAGGGLANQCRFNLNAIVSGSGPLYIADNGDSDPRRTIYWNNPQNDYGGSMYLLGPTSDRCRLTFSAGSRMTFAIGDNGTYNSITGTGTVIFDGIFHVDLAGAGTGIGDHWTIANVTSQTFGQTFQMDGFTAANETLWETTFNEMLYVFDEQTGILCAGFSGSGTEEDPYLIYTAAQLNAIGANPSSWNKRFKLMADVDMGGYTGMQYNIIGNAATKFTGRFDGNGHVIRNLSYSTSAAVNYVGVFGFILDGGVDNLRVEKVRIASGGDYVGGLVGDNQGRLFGCSSSGSVMGRNQVGGLTGDVYRGSVASCDSHCTVAALGQYAGGLSGFVNISEIAGCHADGEVIASGFYSGGLAGYAVGSTINDCYASGPVSGSNFVGGLIGENRSTLNRCYANCTVSGTDSVGGLVGDTYIGTVRSCHSESSVYATGQHVGGLAGYSNNSALSDSYATGPITGNTHVGGFAGDINHGTVTNCYAVGAVTGAAPVGGFAGTNLAGAVTDCFWDKQTTLQSGSAAGTDKTTAEMKMFWTYLSAGWDYDAVWRFCDGTNYPRLRWQIPATDWMCPNGVALEDLVYLSSWWLTNECEIYFGEADLNASGRVDLADFAIFAASWLEGM